MKVEEKLLSSFRDPSGFIFRSKGITYRQINKIYKADYDLLMSSGLYKDLTTKKLLIPHTETQVKPLTKEAYKVIKPEQLPFVSYPYEWCFSMLKDAAILTLKIQIIALEHGMILKDASAFNIQFMNGKPVLIDTLSFEKYTEGHPWVAYKQFTEHFLSPLALMSQTDVRLNRLTQVFLDGVPIDLAAKILPFRSRLKPSILIHVFAHAASQKNFSDQKVSDRQKAHGFSRQALLGLIDSLMSAVKSLKWDPEGTIWADYYKSNNNYRSGSLKAKADLVSKYLKTIKPKTVWDMGANTGHFSRLAPSGCHVYSFDNDYGALEINYQQIKQTREVNILPLFCDLTNPTPAIGWANNERSSLIDRGPADTVLALALIHHLAIANNTPLEYVAKLFSTISPNLIIEFIPKRDSQVKKLLMNREDIFDQYDQENFEKIFKRFYTIRSSTPIKGSKRTLYLMKKK